MFPGSGGRAAASGGGSRNSAKETVASRAPESRGGLAERVAALDEDDAGRKAPQRVGDRARGRRGAFHGGGALHEPDPLDVPVVVELRDVAALARHDEDAQGGSRSRRSRARALIAFAGARYSLCASADRPNRNAYSANPSAPGTSSAAARRGRARVHVRKARPSASEARRTIAGWSRRSRVRLGPETPRRSVPGPEHPEEIREPRAPGPARREDEAARERDGRHGVDRVDARARHGDRGRVEVVSRAEPHGVEAREVERQERRPEDVHDLPDEAAAVDVVAAEEELGRLAEEEEEIRDRGDRDPEERRRERRLEGPFGAGLSELGREREEEPRRCEDAAGAVGVDGQAEDEPGGKAHPRAGLRRARPRGRGGARGGRRAAPRSRAGRPVRSGRARRSPPTGGRGSRAASPGSRRRAARTVSATTAAAARTEGRTTELQRGPRSSTEAPIT